MKFKRQSRLLEIIKNEKIETQEDIVKMLLDEGYQVTQATISRDIRELKLVKLADSSGKVHYRLPNMDLTSELSNEKYRSVLRHGFKSGNPAGQILVIKTLSGMAMAVAAAIDGLGFPQVIGCIAGDDTIFCATGKETDAVTLLHEIQNMI